MKAFKNYIKVNQLVSEDIHRLISRVEGVNSFGVCISENFSGEIFESYALHGELGVNEAISHYSR